MPFSVIELSLIIAKASVNVTGDETDMEYISPTTQRAEVRIVSTPPTFVCEEFDFDIKNAFA